jgi:outer membrane protein TolC
MIYHPAIDLGAARVRMLESRNEIRSARAQADAADRAYRLAWMGYLPDFQLMAGTTFYRNPWTSPLSADPGYGGNFPTHTYMVGVQVTLPIWFLFNERESVTGASHDRAAAQAGLDGVFNQSEVALESAVESVNALAIKIQNFEKHLLPLADQSLNLAMINYRAGKVDFQTLADTAAARRTARLNYATAVTGYLTSYATYGQLLGEDL